MDAVNMAIQSGMRKMDEYIRPKEEVRVDGTVELPLVDLEKLRKVNAEELGELLKDLVKICQEWGVFRLMNHGMSYDMLQNLESQTSRLFSLPSQVKKKAPSPPNCNYEDIYLSGADTNAFRKLWWHESFELLCDPEYIDHYTEKLWPDGDGNEFSSTIKDYMIKSHDLALEILHYITTAVSIYSSKLILQQCRRSTNCVLGLNHYPICKNPEGVLGLSAHTDDDVLTISYEDQVGGLQILKDNTWLHIKPQPNTLIINLGDIMQAWTNNSYSSVEHRVAVNSDKRRLSMSFFLYPEPESLIEPATELINAENPAKYKWFSYINELREISYYNGVKQNRLAEFELS